MLRNMTRIECVKSATNMVGWKLNFLGPTEIIPFSSHFSSQSNNPEIHREVQAFQPISLPQATTLARLQEDKLLDHKKYTSKSSFGPPPPPNPPASYPNTHHTPCPKTPFVQRTQEEMAYRQKKGLCYNCDEKWSSSHRCKGRVLFLVADSDESPSSKLTLAEYPHSPIPELTFIPDEPNPTSDPASLQPHISLHALAECLPSW